LVQLNQVAAGVREDGERHSPELCRLSCERHALRGQSGELARDIGHLEGGEWNTLRKHGFLKLLAGRIGIRFQGEFHVPYRITISPVLDIRTGFPYSIIDEERNFVGPRNLAGRFPNFASLDLQILRTVSLPGRFNKYRVELGLKVFNLTNHFNPRDFQNNLASDDFGGFYNSVSRKYGTRITFVKK